MNPCANKGEVPAQNRSPRPSGPGHPPEARSPPVGQEIEGSDCEILRGAGKNVTPQQKGRKGHLNFGPEDLTSRNRRDPSACSSGPRPERTGPTFRGCGVAPSFEQQKVEAPGPHAGYGGRGTEKLFRRLRKEPR